MKKILSVLLGVTMLLSGLTLGSTASTVTKIKVEAVVAERGESVEVPIRLSGNSGICGATVLVTYDAALTLVNVTRGDALSTLAMTKSGSLSANPVKLVFDGMEEDATNGNMAVLTFTAPQTDGVYEITVSYEEGDIVDGDLQPLDVTLEKGKIIVGGSGVMIKIGDNLVTLPTGAESEGSIYTAFYEQSGELIALHIFPTDHVAINVEVPAAAAYAKVAWWTGLLRPMSGIEKIQLK